MAKNEISEQKLKQKTVISSLPKIVLTEILTTDQFMAIPEVNRHVNLSDEHLLRIYTMRSSGYTTEEISEQLSYPRAIIDKIIGSLEYRAIVDIISQDIINVSRNKLTHASEKATNVLVGLLDSPDERIQIKAAQDILNRVGIDAVKKIEVSNKHEHIHTMTDEQLQAILKAASVATDLAGKIPQPDVDFIEIVDTEDSSE